jgi:hypothetical protein
VAAIGADFETSTVGSTIATSDTGRPTSWDSVTIALGVAVYDNAHVAHGAKSAKFSAVGTTAQDYCRWTSQYGTQTNSYGRLYLYVASWTGFSNLYLVNANSAGTFKALIRVIVTSQKLSITDSTGTPEVLSTNTVATGQWVRIEWHFIHSATVGQIVVKLYNSAESTVVTDTLTSTANWNTGADTNGFWVGMGCGIQNQSGVELWMDNIVTNATDWPGPFPANTVAPTVSGSATVGSTLTSNSGTWNIVPSSYTYQWTRDGGSIGGATSSTYTTVDGDSGHAIGCTVTAVGVVSTETAATASSNTISVTGGTPVTTNPDGIFLGRPRSYFYNRTKVFVG